MRKALSAAAALALAGVYVLSGVTAPPPVSDAADGRTAVLSEPVTIEGISEGALMGAWAKYVTDEPINVVYDGDTECADWAAGCVWWDDPHTIHFDPDAFAAFGGYGPDTDEDMYLVLHEATHVAQIAKWGADPSTVERTLDDYGYGGRYDRNGNRLSSVEYFAECAAFGVLPGIGGGYVDSCEPHLAMRALELLRD